MDLRQLSDVDISSLIKCKKESITSAKISNDYRHKKKNYSLSAPDFPDYQFSLFYRQSLEEDDDYSVGLLVTFPTGKVLTLIRFNGSSHCHPNKIEGTEIEWVTHIHIATNRYIHARKPDGYAEETEKYQCVDEALVYACEYCNVEGIIKPKPNLKLI